MFSVVADIQKKNVKIGVGNKQGLPYTSNLKMS